MAAPPPKEIVEHMKQILLEELRPYHAQLSESGKRLSALVQLAISEPCSTSDDMLRATVVLTHAYLEDFLRTLAAVLLPLADERTLNDVPLAGLGPRPEKFFLGKLVSYRDKSVEDVIRDSVAQYLDRHSFNSPTEIISFLQGVGIRLTTPIVAKLSIIEKMIERRHMIVHKADRSADDSSRLQEIDPNEVVEWIKAAYEFMNSLIEPMFAKQWTREAIQERFNVRIVDPE